MSSERLAPPKGHASWLDYAIETMETRELFLEVCWGESPWPDGTQRDDMRQAAKDELEELRRRAAAATTRSDL